MNIRNTKRRMLSANTYKENLLYNEKKWNIKNIDMIFGPRQLFDTRFPRHLRQNLTHTNHDPRFYTTHSTHASTQQNHPRYLVDLKNLLLLFFFLTKRFVLFDKVHSHVFMGLILSSLCFTDVGIEFPNGWLTPLESGA